MKSKIDTYIKYLEERINKSKSPAIYAERVNIYTKAKEYLIDEAETVKCAKSLSDDDVYTSNNL